MQADEIRDRVIDWMFQHFPCLLQDDFLVEGFVLFCVRIAEQSARDERSRLVRSMLDPKPCEVN